MKPGPQAIRFATGRFAGFRRLACAGAALVIAGCSGGEAGLPPLPSASTGTYGGVTSYGAANAFVTAGYSESALEGGLYRVRAKGTPATPQARLEKIVLARAAQIGVEQQQKFFKAGAFAVSVVCKPAQVLPNKSGKSPADRGLVVEAEVAYAKNQPDPGFLPSAETFARLSREIDEETVAAEAKAAAAAGVTAVCGK